MYPGDKLVTIIDSLHLKFREPLILLRSLFLPFHMSLLLDLLLYSTFISSKISLNKTQQSRQKTV
jgi:hypothetical protein